MRLNLGRLSRAFTLLAALAGVAACVPQPLPGGYYGQSGPAAPTPKPAGRAIAILVPLTGPNAEVGKSMLNAAQLAVAQTGSPKLESQDTRGTPDGAARAAQAAIAKGAGFLVGPLTAGETAAVAPVARAAGVPVLAFTSDPAMAQPGVWTLGITPAQQVRRLLVAMRAENRPRVAALLPQNAFGNALAAGLLQASTDLGLPPPDVFRHDNAPGALNDGLKQLETAERLHVPNQTATEPARIDGLLLGASGEALRQALPTLASYQNGPDHVRLLGTALWQREATRLGVIAGAWFAGPDPGPRAAFERRYAARYGGSPRDLASLAYDATSVARSVSGADGFNTGALLDPAGFSGADGLFVLLPDGMVRRGLVLFQIDATGARVVQPAPQSLSGPGA